MTTDLLRQIAQTPPPAYALLHRPDMSGPDTIDVLVGQPHVLDTLAELPLRADASGHDLLALIPYRQLAERGFDAPDDGTPLVAMTVTAQQQAGVAELLAAVPDRSLALRGGGFDVADDDYAAIVRRIVADEIGEGEGANFVIKRTFVADIGDYSPHSALTLFRRLVRRESGAYWTFLVRIGDRTLVGASPERHISLRAGTLVMNPVSGTYRYPTSGPTLSGLMDFLADPKETDELYMVVDEELKMMARICDGGGRVHGPYLKEMARLAHTEYIIEGRTDRDPREILRETLFAPTVTGSPLESAARVIARYEPEGRGYYSGVLALIGRDAAGAPAMDSAILIRTADIDDTGRVRVAVGATLVRHSDPDSEAAETRAKASVLIAALENGDPARFDDHPSVRAALEQRNATIAEFWMAGAARREAADPRLAGRKVLVVDAEDTFTSMIDHQLRALGLDVRVVRFDEPYTFDGHDLVVMGPGPGDPRDLADPKIGHLRTAIGSLLADRRPFIAVCLSHQVLSTLLGLPLIRRDVPNQGVQKQIDFFGEQVRVGFYNTFAANVAHAEFDATGVGAVHVSRDPDTGEVHGLRGPHFASMQFHAESVLTQDGIRLFARLIGGVLDAAVAGTR